MVLIVIVVAVVEVVGRAAVVAWLDGLPCPPFPFTPPPLPDPIHTALAHFFLASAIFPWKILRYGMNIRRNGESVFAVCGLWVSVRTGIIPVLYVRCYVWAYLIIPSARLPYDTYILIVVVSFCLFKN